MSYVIDEEATYANRPEEYMMHLGRPGKGTTYIMCPRCSAPHQRWTDTDGKDFLLCLVTPPKCLVGPEGVKWLPGPTDTVRVDLERATS